MKLRTKKNSEKVEQITKQSRSFEVSIADMARRSEKRAWLVAGGAVIMSVILAGGYIALVPLKEKVPYLVMADPYTGTSSVAKLGDSDDSITTSESINKSNAANFVISRESYDWYLINQRDWNVVNAMGSTSVLATYRNLFASTNPNNPDVIYGKNKAARVRIKSIQLRQSPSGEGYDGATIRFDKLIINKQTDKVETAAGYIATMSFEYKSNLKMEESYRIANPLGFRVIEYRVDPDSFSGSKNSTALGEIDSSEAQTPPAVQPSPMPFSPPATNREESPVTDVAPSSGERE